MRTFLATIIGLALSIVGIQLLEYVGHIIYPIGKIEGFDPTSAQELREIMLYMPFVALLLVIMAHVVGLMIGLIAARVIDSSSLLPLFVISGLLMMSAILNVTMLPHPLWFVVTDLGLIIILSILFIATRKKA